MGKDINLNSSEWCEVAFEGRNQKYGAYTLRKTSSKRHLMAFFTVLALAILVSFIPTLIGAVEEALRAATGTMTETITMTEVNTTVEEVAPEVIPPVNNEPPPPPLKSSIGFTSPVIKDDSEVSDDQLIKDQTKLKDSKDAISLTDIVGTDDEHGLDIREVIEHREITNQQKQKPFERVEVMPEFPGGMKEMYAFINKNLNYPQIAKEANIQGRVTLRFVVTAEGKVTEIQVIEGIHESCNREAMRVVGLMPDWIPGEQQGKKVAVYYNIPIIFRLEL